MKELEPIDDVTQFHSVDQATKPLFFTQFMDTSHAQQTTRCYQQEIIERLAIRNGATILDIGCGTGQDTQDLVQAVGSSGRVVGIDKSETMLQVARTRADQAQLPVEYVLADAMQLPFADASFDGCRASRVLEHLSEPKLALAEMVRVARPGARIVVTASDLDLTIVELSDRTLARKIMHAACDQIQHPWLGRQMPRLFQQAGLSDISIEGRMMQLNYAFFQMVFRGILQRAQTTEVVTEEEITRFWSALEREEQEQHFFAGSVGFIVSGRKPL
jgi:ubiquinone/menaquinone biosynthesis C-methylase UbiE